MSKLLSRIATVIRLSRAGRGEELDTMIAGLEANSRPEGSLHSDEAWMPATAWNMAAKRITAQVRDKEWAAICSSSTGLVSLVTLAKPLDGPYEVSFYQGRAADLTAVLKSSAPVAYDPWRDTSNAMVLAKAGVKVVEFRNSIANISEPMQATRDFVVNGHLRHAGHPVLTVHVLNVIDRFRVMPSLMHTHYPRRLQGQRIDGALALIMAVGLALAPRGGQ